MNETDINQAISSMNGDTNNVSDGYHTFGELYDHRCILYISLLQAISTINSLREDVEEKHPFIWRTRTHSDGSPSYPGWFVLGA